MIRAITYFSVSILSALSLSAENTPVSTLSKYAAATAASRTVPSSFVVPISDTHSMRPAFDGNVFALVRPTPFDQLTNQTIVIYRRKDGGHTIHMLVRKKGNRFVAKGLNNLKCDRELVTVDNYLYELIGLIYYHRNDLASNME